MLSSKEASLLAALEPRAADEGIEIVTVEVVGSRKAPTIRVYLDTPEGITFEEITTAQAWVNEIMDELDPFPGAYTLEVSSPGIDRPLRTPEHFARFAGDEVYVMTTSPVTAPRPPRRPPADSMPACAASTRRKAASSFPWKTERKSTFLWAISRRRTSRASSTFPDKDRASTYDTYVDEEGIPWHPNLWRLCKPWRTRRRSTSSI